MKARINLELWDNTTEKDLEKFGMSKRFLKACYISSFEELMKEACAEGMKYSLNVEVEDNTIQN